MPVKRSRMSSSFGETEVLNHLSAPLAWPDRLSQMRPPAAAAGLQNNKTKVLKKSAAAGEVSKLPRPGILRLSSPLQETIVASVDAAIGGFLQNCHYCRRKICENEEVFMYRDLCAFCSAECRDSRIALDNKMEEYKNKAKSQT